MSNPRGNVEVQGASVVRNGKVLTTITIKPVVPYTPVSPIGMYRESDGQLMATGVTELEAQVYGEMYLEGYAAGYDEGYAACLAYLRKVTNSGGRW